MFNAQCSGGTAALGCELAVLTLLLLAPGCAAPKAVRVDLSPVIEAVAEVKADVAAVKGDVALIKKTQVQLQESGPATVTGNTGGTNTAASGAISGSGWPLAAVVMVAMAAGMVYVFRGLWTGAKALKASLKAKQNT